MEEQSLEQPIGEIRRILSQTIQGIQSSLTHTLSLISPRLTGRESKLLEDKLPEEKLSKNDTPDARG